MLDTHFNLFLQNNTVLWRNGLLWIIIGLCDHFNRKPLCLSICPIQAYNVGTDNHWKFIFGVQVFHGNCNCHLKWRAQGFAPHKCRHKMHCHWWWDNSTIFKLMSSYIQKTAELKGESQSLWRMSLCIGMPSHFITQQRKVWGSSDLVYTPVTCMTGTAILRPCRQASQSYTQANQWVST